VFCLVAVVSPERRPWATMLTKSVSFLTGKDEVLSIMVPLADEEDSEDDDSSRILQPTRV